LDVIIPYYDYFVNTPENSLNNIWDLDRIERILSEPSEKKFVQVFVSMIEAKLRFF